MGKSRIIAAFTTIIAKSTFKKLNSIYIAFSSKTLLETDQAVYKSLSILLGIKIHLSIGIDEATQKMLRTDLLILDEADWHLFDKLSNLPAACYGILAMTATDVTKKGGNEQSLLEKLKFEVCDSKIYGGVTIDTEVKVIDLDRFFSIDRSTRPRLVWCHEYEHKYITGVAENWGHKVEKDIPDFKTLRSLEEMKCYIVTELDLMRGVDYRSAATTGIDLLLARDFPHTRAYIQGLGRVGRFGQPSERFTTSIYENQLINKAEELALNAAIGHKLDQSKQQQKQQKTLDFFVQEKSKTT